MRNLILSISAFLLLSLSGFAQESRAIGHSIEISSGIPPVSAMMYAPYSHDVHPESDPGGNGVVYDNLHHQQLNMSFIWNRNERWDMGVMLGLSTASYRQKQYAEWSESLNRWTGELNDLGGKMDFAGIYASVFWRLKYCHMEHAHLYSAFGIGIDPNVGISLSKSSSSKIKDIPFLPMPYLTPIGICIGEKSRVYGLAEITIGTGATAVLAGIGIRL